MQYQITSDNIQLSSSMENLTKEKFVRIETRLKDIPQGSKFARVVLNTAPDEMFTVKVNLDVNGKDYFSDETDYSLEGALIKTVEELVAMLEKDKDIQDKKDVEEIKKIEEDLLLNNSTE